MSWHYHDSDAELFAFVPVREVKWDGHTTEEKYRRLAALVDIYAGFKKAMTKGVKNA
jgi:hypothetical protein